MGADVPASALPSVITMTKAQYTFSQSTDPVLFFETGEAGRERREKSPHQTGDAMRRKMFSISLRNYKYLPVSKERREA